jgi:hypothetical protein
MSTPSLRWKPMSGSREPLCRSVSETSYDGESGRHYSSVAKDLTAGLLHCPGGTDADLRALVERTNVSTCEEGDGVERAGPVRHRMHYDAPHRYVRRGRSHVRAQLEVQGRRLSIGRRSPGGVTVVTPREGLGERVAVKAGVTVVVRIGLIDFSDPYSLHHDHRLLCIRSPVVVPCGMSPASPRHARK